jgi:hypothetical protein
MITHDTSILIGCGEDGKDAEIPGNKRKDRISDGLLEIGLGSRDPDVKNSR